MYLAIDPKFVFISLRLPVSVTLCIQSRMISKVIIVILGLIQVYEHKYLNEAFLNDPCTIRDRGTGLRLDFGQRSRYFFFQNSLELDCIFNNFDVIDMSYKQNITLLALAEIY